MNLATPLSYLITKGEATAMNFDAASVEILDIIRIAVDEGISMVQIREKRLPARLLCELVEATEEITRGTATKLLVNDRADIAVAAGADGVHLTANSLPPEVIRNKFPSGLLIGVSVHSIEAAAEAARRGADFAVLGPVFSTPGKGEPIGIEQFGYVCDRLKPFPVLALGGIDEMNVDAVLAAGASGFAAIRALNDPISMRSIMKTLRK